SVFARPARQRLRDLALVIQSQHLLVQLLVFVLLRLVLALQRGQALAPLLVDDELSAVDLRVGVIGIIPFVALGANASNELYGSNPKLL
ncbi:MAG: hypothetical protein WB586_17600, partial [Chthoniobacterales bacterium]